MKFEGQHFPTEDGDYMEQVASVVQLRLQYILNQAI